MIKTLIIYIAFSSIGAHAAAPYDVVSIQGFLKSTAGVPVNGTYNGRVTLYQNSAPCWNTGGILVPVTFTDGAFVKSLSTLR